MKTRSCVNCYFHDTCKSTRVCGSFSPLIDVQMTEEEEWNLIEDERQEFARRFYRCLEEEDRLQDYFG